MLSISNLHVSVGDKPILKGLTFDVPAGEGLVIMGPNDVDRLVPQGIAGMERGNEIDQEELFAKWRAKYG